MKQKKTKWIILTLLVLFLSAVGIIAVLLLKKPEKEEDAKEKGMGFEASVVLEDSDNLQKQYNEMPEKTKEGYMTLSMKTSAFSKDGTNFSCYLGNAEENKYNLYLTISLDDTEEELCRTELIPIGGHIESFTSGKKLEAGTYSATVGFVQVEEDLRTIHSQVYAGLELVVGE